MYWKKILEWEKNTGKGKSSCMEVRVAESAGFCFGVERAVNLVYEQVETGKTIYTYGPITHNDEVVSELAKKGVCILEGEESLKGLTSGTVVIRAHGVPRRVYELLREKGIECVDATCPFVKRIHEIVEKESRAGKHAPGGRRDRRMVRRTCDSAGNARGSP